LLFLIKRERKRDFIEIVYIETLLGNGYEINKYAAAVAKYWPVDINKGRVFAALSAARSYKEGKSRLSRPLRLGWSYCG
jgi:hypothetical protein